MHPNPETIRMFNKPKRGTLFGFRRSALLEIVLVLGTLLILDATAFDGNRYWSANPHPFWFLVLIIACQYGTKEALIAALACSAALLIDNLPEQSIDQDGYAYLLYILKLPLMWLVSSVVFGELRQMHIRERDQLEEGLEQSETREQQIAQSYQWVKQLKDQLELRMAGQLRSSISAYRAAKSMESLSQSEVMQGLEELVRTSLHPEQFSIYSLNKDGLDATLTYGWKDTDNYLRHFGTTNALYQVVIGQRNVLCIANAEHEKLLAGQAMLVGPLFDHETGEAVGLLKIEKLGFTDLHLSNIEAFTAICEWAGMALANARKYQSAKDGSIVNPDHNLLTHGYFKRYNDHITALGERVGFDVSKIVIRLANPDQLDNDTRTQLARALSEAVDTVLRDIDLAFDHQEQGGEYSVVLPATGNKGAQIVLKKIREELESRAAKISKQAEFAFSIQNVYEKRAA